MCETAENCMSGVKPVVISLSVKNGNTITSRIDTTKARASGRVLI